LNHETGPKLLRSLIKRQEWSPLEMVSLTMEIVTTRDIARQILRHRSFSFQEFSQRYAAVTEAPVFRDARLQDHKDRQNSLATEDAELREWWVGAQEDAAVCTDTLYREALRRGIAKEVARTLLPEGMTMSRLFMAGTLRSWIHYIMLRADAKTQLEHRRIAEDARSILVEQFPVLSDVIMGTTSDETLQDS
jgi:thymidylate synthase (FAD)